MGSDSNVLGEETNLGMTEDNVAHESLKLGEIESTVDVGMVTDETAEHDEDHSSVDYAKFSKADFVELLKDLSKDENFKKIDAVLKEVKPLYHEIRSAERANALSKFISEGGTEENFDYKADENDISFEATLRLLKDKRFNFFKKIEDQKTDNLKTKEELLDKLRTLAEVEDTEHSFQKFKEIQTQWKQIGLVPNANAKTLWANYSALVDRFYDNRSIHFELKELDRKKNLSLKLDLCHHARQSLNFAML